MEQPLFVTDNIEFTSLKSEYVSVRERSIQAVRNALDSVKGISVNSSVESNSISGVPNFIHLNPNMLALAILFRAKHKKKTLDELTKALVKKSINDLLSKLFVNVKPNTKTYYALKADALRYIRLVEENTRST